MTASGDVDKALKHNEHFLQLFFLDMHYVNIT